MSEKQVLAVDYGASGGRVMLGGFDGASFTISELHRFPNDPVKLGDTMYWDVLRLYFEMKQGIVKSKAYGAISGIGVDTWGVDFGLLDREGRLRTGSAEEIVTEELLSRVYRIPVVISHVERAGRKACLTALEPAQAE